MEERLKGAEAGIERVEAGLTRVHSRVDTVLKMLEERFGGGLRDTITDCIRDHEKGEAQLLDVRFRSLETKIENIAEQGEQREKSRIAREEALADQRKHAASVLAWVCGGIGAIVVPAVGFFGTRFFDTFFRLAAVLEKMDGLK